MCGIVGYIGNNNSVDYLLNGLKSLEYRGYDSAGLALIENNRINLIKSVGKVQALENKLADLTISSTIGIAHTRWATHGKPTDENSHPHLDCKKEIAIVHNGIIENYLTLKKELIAKGHIFKSETDTEVIVHLLEEELADITDNYEENLIKSVNTINKKLKGSYALNILWSKTPDVIIGTRIKAPLLIGTKDDCNFFASDISAFIKYTDQVIYLDDYDVAVLKKDAIKLYDADNNEKYFNKITVDKNVNEATKNGLEHFMLKEIREQPHTVMATIESILENIDNAFGIDLMDIKNVKNVLLIGCGTAYHAALVAKYWIEEFAGVPTQAELASEYKYRTIAQTDETLAVFISQSGETADTVAALEKAKSSGFKTVAICNVYSSTISRIADYTFFTKCGPEISVASTKAFTAQLASLFALSILIGKSNKSLDDKDVIKLLRELSHIPKSIENIIDDEKSIEDIAKKYYTEKSYYFLGRNVNYPIALEAALKLKEITYFQAEGFAAGEIKHGPIAMIEENTPVFSIMGYDSVYDKMLNASQEVIARGANVIAITDKEGDQHMISDITDRIVLDNTPQYLSPILNIVALQLFAYHVAKLNGREIDQPRNLAKSVTVE